MILAWFAPIAVASARVAYARVAYANDASIKIELPS